MTKRLAFWVLMLIWLVVGIAWHFGVLGPYGVWGIALIPFLLFALLGWHVFGAPVQG